MASPPAPATAEWPNNRTEKQIDLELWTHIVYRDTFHLLNPTSSLEPAFAKRLRALRLNSTKHVVTREFLAEIRNYPRSANPNFYEIHTHICIDAFTLLSRLENMRDFEQDMKVRLTGRLSAMRMVQKWDDKGEALVWVVEINEEVREGLGGRRDRNRESRRDRDRESRRGRGKGRRRKRGSGEDGEEMEVDG